MNDKGYIVVETVGAFVPFMLLVVSILSLVNIITLQVRLHYAMTQTAGTLSMYCYAMEAAGAARKLSALDEKASAAGGAIDGVTKAISSLSGTVVSDTDIAYLEVPAAVNPEEMIKNFAYYSLNEVKEMVSSHLAAGMIKRYLTDEYMTADEYFNHMRISSFELTQCSIIDKDDNVKLTVNYEVEYTFGALRLPFTPTLRIQQTVITKAWLAGSGMRYVG